MRACTFSISTCLAASALAQPHDRGERPGDAPGTPATMLGDPGILWPRSFPPTHQANVGAGQLNIIGDAANEPSIAVDPSNGLRIVVGWRQFDTVSSNFRQAGYAWSVDGGRTFTKGTHNPGVFRSDPVLRWGPDGTVHYYSLTTITGRYTCDMFRSTNGGQTWLPPVFAAGGDKNWFTIGMNAGAGQGNIYAHWTSYYTCCDGFSFARSRDAGATYPDLTHAPFLPFWGTSSVGPDGELYICGNNGFDQFSVSRSSDAKLNLGTITFPVAVNGIVMAQGQSGFDPNSPNPAGILGQAWIDVDRSSGPRRGWVYMLSSVGYVGSDPLDVMMVRSTDGGQTWSAAFKVNDEAPGANAWQWFGTLGVSPNGRLDVIYNDTQGTSDFHHSVTKYKSSSDGGFTWTPSTAIGPVWDSWIGWPNQNKIGDYYDIASDKLGCYLVYSATYNGEEDVYVARIGPYDCNNNGVDDATDIANHTSRDCNANAIPDECEIAAGTLADSNHDGIADVCPPCPADFNADGSVDFFDYDAFVSCFEGIVCPPGKTADFDADGAIDFFDYDAFVVAFETPC
ncbi:MAG: sialidase family protein [Planctomycetota bacterium]